MSKLSLRKHGVAVGAIVLAGGLAVGGATAYAAAGSPATSSTSTAADTASITGTTGTGPLTMAKPGHARVRIPVGIHGQVTVKNGKTGEYVVREWQRGQITAVSGSTVTVKSADGTTWTWTTASNTKITRDGKKIAESALATGNKVEILGKQSGSANDATRIFAPTATQGSGTTA